MEYLKKTEFTGCHQGMRYRLEQTEDPEGGKKLLVTVWPEPFNFLKTPEEKKQRIIQNTPKGTKIWKNKIEGLRGQII